MMERLALVVLILLVVAYMLALVGGLVGYLIVARWAA